MSDYIKRDDAIKIASGYCNPANIAKELAKIPAADVRENVHAKAIPDFEQFSPFEGYEGGTIQTGWKCSACGSVRIGRFCADCGAIMDGGDDE